MSSRLGLLLIATLSLGCARGTAGTVTDFDPSQGTGVPDASNGTQDSGSTPSDSGVSADGGSGADSSMQPVDAGPVCSDKACHSSESCTTCAEDCGPCAAGYCGDGMCQAPELCNDCAIDCGSCGGSNGTNCGSCSLLTFGRESDCIGNTLYRCHDDACLISQPCGARTCMRANDAATCQ